MQGAPPLAPVPGKARESRKKEMSAFHCHILHGFLLSTNSNSAIDDSSSIVFDTIWVVGQVPVDCIRSTI